MNGSGAESRMCLDAGTRGQQVVNGRLGVPPSCRWLKCASSTWSSPPWTEPLSAGRRRSSVTWRTRRSSRKCRLRDLRYLWTCKYYSGREKWGFCVSSVCPPIIPPPAHVFLWIHIPSLSPIRVPSPPTPPFCLLSTARSHKYLSIQPTHLHPSPSTFVHLRPPLSTSIHGHVPSLHPSSPSVSSSFLSQVSSLPLIFPLLQTLTPLSVHVFNREASSARLHSPTHALMHAREEADVQKSRCCVPETLSFVGDVGKICT